MKVKIGITGGIGSGKSVVSNLIRCMGYPVYNADIEAKRLCNNSIFLKEKLKSAFGKGIYTLQDELNKSLFASIIFSKKEQLTLANEIIHPVVQADFVDWANRQQSNLVFVESAILLDSILKQKTDEVIVVLADEELRIERVVHRENVNRLLVTERIRNQLSEQNMASLADFTVNNNSEELLIPQVENILSEIEKKYRQKEVLK